jgi:hypothetical protein
MPRFSLFSSVFMKDHIENSPAVLPENGDASGTVQFKRKGGALVNNERISCHHNASIIPGLKYDLLTFPFKTREELQQILDGKKNNTRYELDKIVFNNPQKITDDSLHTPSVQKKLP